MQPGIDFAGITQHRADGGFETSAPSADLVRQADRWQYQLRQGPCVEAIFTDDTLVSPDLKSEDRWPQWTPRAQKLGIASVVSVHLYTDSNAVGALNMYSVKQRHYTQAELDAAKLIGAHASVALAHFRGEQHLWKAIDARHRIGIAQGILMTKYQLDPNQAFAFLIRLSQTHNIKLHLLADHIVQHRQLPDLDLSATTAVWLHRWPRAVFPSRTLGTNSARCPAVLVRASSSGRSNQPTQPPTRAEHTDEGK